MCWNYNYIKKVSICSEQSNSVKLIILYCRVKLMAKGERARMLLHVKILNADNLSVEPCL